MNTPLLLYDGHCPFCHFWVRFLIKFDKKSVFRFAPLTGSNATAFFKKEGLEVPDSIVLVQDDRYFVASRAVFGILKTLGGAFRLGLLFQILPYHLTDWIYKGIAKNRFVFGKPYPQCFIPDKEQQTRFLD